jgi:hypothetical protein
MDTHDLTRPHVDGGAASGDGSRLLFGPEDFSLVLGGPLFQILRRVRLSDDALALTRTRILVMSLAAWLPLLALSLLDGQAFGGTATIPFLLDLDVHVRFLVALPLLIAAEIVVHQRMRSVARVFLDRHLIPDAGMARFEAAFASAVRLRNSVLAEVLLIAFVYGVGILIVWRHYTALDAATWYATPSAAGFQPSLAGMWYGYVSLPIFQFLLVRWYFRLVIWIRFLWQVSRIELSLVPTHPDRVGGLGFLAGTAYAFSLLAVAHGAMLSGQLANRIFFLGDKLTDYKAQIAVIVLFPLVMVLSPLLVFAGQLALAKQKGLREYGTLAERYVRQFDTKWLHGGAPPDEPLVGSADIQSLADLGNSFEVVRTMRFTPVTKEMVIQLALCTLAPVAPLVLTMMPLDQLLKTLLGVLF